MDDIMEHIETDRGDEMDPMEVHQDTDRTNTVNTNYTISQMEQSVGNNQRYQARIPSPIYRGRQRPYSVTQTPSTNPMANPNMRVPSRHQPMDSDSQIYEDMGHDADLGDMQTPVISPMDDYDHRQPSHHSHHHDHHHDDDEVMKGMSEDALMQGMTKGAAIPYISGDDDDEGDTSAERQTVDFYYDPNASNRNLEEEESAGDSDQMQTSGFIAADYQEVDPDPDYEDEYYEDEEDEDNDHEVNWNRVRTVSEI